MSCRSFSTCCEATKAARFTRVSNHRPQRRLGPNWDLLSVLDAQTALKARSRSTRKVPRLPRYSLVAPSSRPRHAAKVLSSPSEGGSAGEAENRCGKKAGSFLPAESHVRNDAHEPGRAVTRHVRTRSTRANYLGSLYLFMTDLIEKQTGQVPLLFCIISWPNLIDSIPFPRRSHSRHRNRRRARAYRAAGASPVAS